MRAIIVLSCLFAVSLAALGPTWIRNGRADPNDVTPARILLKQRNTDVLASKTLDISNPNSPNYGQWLSIDEILDIVAPPAEDVAPVLAWLRSHEGVRKIENRRDTILFEATVQAFHDLLNADLYYYVKQENGRRTIIRGDYTVPTQFAHIIDFVVGLTELPLKTYSNRNTRTKVENNNSAGYVYPNFIRQLYNISDTLNVAKTNSSLCLAEFQDDTSYNKKDLVTFATDTSEPTINVTEIVGPYVGSQPDAESTLDVQYGGAIARGANIWFWTVDQWMMEFAQDLFARTPAPYVVSMSWGWPDNAQCQIVSCSNTTTEQYVLRTDVEFNKVTARGISLLAASGDQGAPGDNDPDCTNSKKPLSNIFPGDSPWVTSVGATMLTPTKLGGKHMGSNVVEAAPLDVDLPSVCNKFHCAALPATEEVCTYPQALITTGGGFASYEPRPAWQNATVNAYLKSGVTLPPAGSYNHSNRAFPDIAALGHSYLICISGQFEQVDGTSCSSPVIGGMVALLNGWRFSKGKPSLGFLNPLLYQMAAQAPKVFTDFTKGNNKCTESCCDTNGWLAAKGWDPVVGLGTPNFGLWQDYIESLGI